MTEQWIIAKPGGLVGPFWGIVSSSGRVIAMRLPDEATAQQIVAYRSRCLAIDDVAEEIGRIADQANNVAAASQLPVSPAIHIEGMRFGLVSIRDALQEVYTQITGDNPWEGMP